jgi:hypothetical protein
MCVEVTRWLRTTGLFARQNSTDETRTRHEAAISDRSARRELQARQSLRSGKTADLFLESASYQLASALH